MSEGNVTLKTRNSPCVVFARKRPAFGCLRQRAITADMAVRLANYFSKSDRFWPGLQMDYDLEAARKQLHAA